jgi:hypothetical protein
LLKKVWHDPVWSGVISAAILTAFAGVGSYLLNWWPSIGHGLVTAWALLVEASPVPRWLLLLLTLLSLPMLLLFVVGFWYWFSNRNNKMSGHDWNSYTTDNFYDLRWRWKYSTDRYPLGLTSFCPYCDFQVYPKNISAFRVVDHIAFSCESCGRQLGEFEESYEALENKVVRFIQQRLRNNTWKDQRVT